MKKDPGKLSFSDAVSEVEEILAGLEQDDVDIDRLGDEVKRAVALIKVCREKLAKTDREVRDLVAGLEADTAAEITAESDPDVPFG